jgi:hypothetical protein
MNLPAPAQYLSSSSRGLEAPQDGCPPNQLDIGDGQGCRPIEQVAEEAGRGAQKATEALALYRRAGTRLSPEACQEVVNAAAEMGRDVSCTEGLAVLRDLTTSELREAARRTIREAMPALGEEYLNMDRAEAELVLAQMSGYSAEIAGAIGTRDLASVVAAVGAAVGGSLPLAAEVFAVSATSGPLAVVGAVAAAVVVLVGSSEALSKEYTTPEELAEFDPLEEGVRRLLDVCFTEIVSVGYPAHLAREIADKMGNFVYPLATQFSTSYYRAMDEGCTEECAYLPHTFGFWGSCCREYAKAIAFGPQMTAAAFGGMRKLTRLLLAAIEPSLYCCHDNLNCCYLESKGDWYVPGDPTGRVLEPCEPCMDVTRSLSDAIENFNSALNSGGEDAFKKKTTGGAPLIMVVAAGAGVALLSQALGKRK